MIHDHCLSCHGTGRVPWRMVDGVLVARICPWCYGTGVQPSAEPRRPE